MFYPHLTIEVQRYEKKVDDAFDTFFNPYRSLGFMADKFLGNL